MPPLRFPRRSLFWFIIFLGMLVALPTLPLLGSFMFFVWSRRFSGDYLLAYAESAKIIRPAQRYDSTGCLALQDPLPVSRPCFPQ